MRSKRCPPFVKSSRGGGHVGPERFGKLHGERAHASRGPVDQDLLPRLNVSLVAECLEGGASGDGHGRGLLERDVGGLQD